jgi:hypothetical protein
VAKLILYTGVLIDAVRRRLDLARLVAQDDIALPAIALTEYVAGVEIDPDASRRAIPGPHSLTPPTEPAWPVLHDHRGTSAVPGHRYSSHVPLIMQTGRIGTSRASRSARYAVPPRVRGGAPGVRWPRYAVPHVRGGVPGTRRAGTRRPCGGAPGPKWCRLGSNGV